MAQNEFDQLWIIPIEVITGQRIIIFRAQSLKCTEPPIRPIKQGFIGLAVDEGIFVTAPIGGFRKCHPAGKLLTNGADPIHFVFAGHDGEFWRLRCIRADIITGPTAAREIIIGQKLCIGEGHGDPAHPQMGRQFSA